MTIIHGVRALCCPRPTAGLPCWWVPACYGWACPPAGLHHSSQSPDEDEVADGRLMMCLQQGLDLLSKQPAVFGWKNTAVCPASSMCLQCGRSRRSQVIAVLSDFSLPTSWPACSWHTRGHLKLTQACPPLQPPDPHGEGVQSLCPAESDA